MKKLQSNFTTPEQSKRLLELGVPAWTADCYYIRPFGNQIYDKTPNINYNLQNYKETTQRFGQTPNGIGKYSTTTPCWSVGRLIEIAKICSKSRYALRGLFLFLEECKADECMSQVMDYFEICNYQFDFSKLEEE